MGQRGGILLSIGVKLTRPHLEFAPTQEGSCSREALLLSCRHVSCEHEV